ncbi:hypothetical protein SAMN05421810_11426 [Amycolatopsis arida]|uniref:Uncharacterized protein n=1 Tax=Amycolatopsis arida TaxID=587909 RepID=A0A1I6AR28_9PSEU|nr:hypothetical protein [Amycolatopsis arida]TDX97597.1 hypothetical protein CLV69_102701 [Amycolatopsis arida]SFQ71151.1 hypothetical protein SAMN05421810_11426 [Amycolatopsis arida]
MISSPARSGRAVLWSTTRRTARLAASRMVVATPPRSTNRSAAATRLLARVAAAAARCGERGGAPGRPRNPHSAVIEASLGWLLVFADPDGPELHLYTWAEHGLDQSHRPGYGRRVAGGQPSPGDPRAPAAPR